MVSVSWMAVLSFNVHHPRDIPGISKGAYVGLSSASLTLVSPGSWPSPPMSRWPEGIGTRLWQNLLWVRVLVQCGYIVSQVHWAYYYSGPFGVLRVHVACCNFLHMVIIVLQKYIHILNGWMLNQSNEVCESIVIGCYLFAKALICPIQKSTGDSM